MGVYNLIYFTSLFNHENMSPLPKVNIHKWTQLKNTNGHKLKY